MARRPCLIWQDIGIPYHPLTLAICTLERICKLDQCSADGLYLYLAISGRLRQYMYAARVREGLHNPGDFMLTVKLFKSSRLHDYAFAVHGILTAAGIQLPLADYTAPLEDVFRTYFCCMINRSDSCGLLEQLSGLRQLSQLVSWVPDWTLRAGVAIPSQVRFRMKETDVVPKQRVQHPSYDLQLTNGGRQLRVKGVVKDIIVERACLSFIEIGDFSDASDFSTLDNNADEKAEDGCLDGWLTAHLAYRDVVLRVWNLRVWRTFISFVLSKTSTLDEGLTSLMETLHGRILRTFDPAGTLSQLMNVIREEASETQTKPGSNETKSEVGSPSGSTPSEGAIDSPECPSLAAMAEWKVLKTIANEPRLYADFIELTALNTSQTVFYTASGKFGMAPHPIRAGDHIFMYVGSYCPAVIRKLPSDNYHWIASAYVCDTMSHDIFPEDMDRLEYFTFE